MNVPITKTKGLGFGALPDRLTLIKFVLCNLLLSLLPVTVIAAQTVLLPGDLNLGTAVGSQTNPVIAAGGNGYLAVWEDFRSTPYIGPPFSTEGSGSDIYAQLLDATGQPISDQPIPLSTRFGDQLAPQVAWNGENWLVTWRTTCECWSFSYHIQGVRVSPTGVVLDPKPLIIHTNAADSGWDHFRLTANGTEWLVVIAEQRAVRIAASGNVINNGGTELVDTTSLTVFELYASQGEYLLLSSPGTGTLSATARRFGSNLTPIGSPFSVPSRYAAAGNGGYFLLFRNGLGIGGQFMSLDGTLGPVIEITDPNISVPLFNTSTLKVAFDGLQWWTSWVETGRGAVFARVSTNGNVLDYGGQALVASSGSRPTNEHDLVGLAAGGAQFVWHDNRAGVGMADIFAEQLDGNAASSAPALLSSAARHQHYSDIAAGSSEFLTVFISEISGEKRIVGQRLNANGRPLDNMPFLIHTIAAGASHSPPRVDFDGIRYMVVWSENAQILAKRVAPDGSVIDAQPSGVMTGLSPDVSGLNGIFLVVGTEQVNSPQFYHPFSMRVDGTNLSLLDAQPVLLGQYFARYPRVTSFGGRWLATWQRNFSHDDINSNLHANFIGQDGIADSEFTYGFFGGAPVVAASADTAVLVWRTHSEKSNANNILARLIDVNGTLDPATITISAGPTREFAPAVSWSGTDFVIAWTDKRNEVIYFDQRSETYAARVDSTGNLLDSNGFAVGDRSLSSIHPAIAGLNGTTVIGASMFRYEPTLQSYRVGVESYGSSGANWPVALLDAVPNQGDITLLVNFDSSASFDPDGNGITSVIDFGNGSSASGSLASETYTEAGNYLAQASIANGAGESTKKTQRIRATAVNIPPVAHAIADRVSGHAPLAVRFEADGSYDVDDGIQNWRWDFGDGGSYFGKTAFHTFQTAGVWTNTLTTIDFRGAASSAEIVVEVLPPNNPPTAVASATPMTGTSPLPVAFSASGSSDSDGTIQSYFWEFGDGATASSGETSHTYAMGGIYQATLTVTDDDGSSATDTVTIDVAQGDLQSTAISDYLTELGSISAGSFADTSDADGIYEELTEKRSNGKPSKQRSELSHTWLFDVKPGDRYSFVVNAYHSANTEGDHFLFEYSLDNINFAPMLTVSNTSPGVQQSYTFTTNVAGNLYIRVTDTDRTAGSSLQDTLYVDAMTVVTSFIVGGDSEPPLPPTGLSAVGGNGQVTLDWADNTEADLNGYFVERATTAGGPYLRLNDIAVTQSTYLDSAVSNGTTYFYVLRAVDLSGNESSPSNEVSATPVRNKRGR